MATGGTAVTFNDLSYDELNFRIETLRKNAEQLSEDLRAGLVIDVKPAMDALDDLNNKINQAEKAKAKLDREYSQPVATSYQDVTSQIESLQNKAATLREILREGISFDFNRDIVELKNVETQIKNLENVKSTLSKSSFVPADPQNYQEVLAYIDVYKEKIKELQTYLKSGETGDQFIQDKQALEAYTKDLARLEKMKLSFGISDEAPKIQGVLGLLKETFSTKLQLMQAKGELFSSSNVEDTQQKIQALESRMKDLSSIWKNMGDNPVVNAFRTIGSVAKNVATTIGSGLVQGFKSAVSGAKALASSILSLASEAFNSLKSAVFTTLGNMKNLVSGGFNALSKGVGAVKSGLQTVRSHMQNLTKKATPNLMKTLTSFKSMMMRRIKRTFISSIFNQAKEGLQQLAKSSKDFNKTMSNIKNASKEVAGNLSITLGNLLQTVEPVLTALLGWINKVFEAINGLFAMISGKKTMMVAKKGTDDYAKSLKNASGSAKDLNHQLYGFDEITRQEDNNSNSSGKIGYEQKEIGSVLGGISDFFKEMLEAFQSGQFEKVGQLVAEQLNKVTESITDWVKDLRPKARKWVSNITRILNGLLDSKLFKNLGKLIGQGLNLAFDVAKTFLTTFNFGTLGEVLADSINSIFEEVEWDSVGETFAAYFSSIWKFLGNFFGTLNWSDIGYKLSLAVGSLFENLDWESFKAMWANGINGVFSMIGTFIDGVDWGEIALTIDTNLTDLIQNKINWDEIKNTLSLAVKALQDVFHVFANSDFFTSLSENLGGVLGDMLNNIDWKQLATDIKTGLGKLRTAFWNFITQLDLPSLSVKIGDAISGWFDDKNINAGWEEGKKKAKEGLKQIADAFNILVNGDEHGNGKIDLIGIATTIGNDVASMFADFPIEQVVTNIGTLTTEMASAFFKLIGKIFEPGVDEFGHQTDSLGTRLANGINGIFTNAEGKVDTTKFEGLAQSIGEAIVGILTNIDDLLSGIKWSEVIENIKTFAKTVPWTDIISKLLSVAKNFLVGAIKLVTGLTQAVIDAIGTLDWGKIAEGILDFLLSGLLELAKSAGGVAKRVLDLLFGGKHEIEEAVNGLYSNVSEGIFGVNFEYEVTTELGVQKRREYVEHLKQQLEEQKEQAIKEAVAEFESWSGEESDGSIEAEIELEYDAKIAEMDTYFQDESLQLSRNQFADYVIAWCKANGIKADIPLDGSLDVTISEVPNWEHIKEQFGVYGIELTNSFIEKMNGKGKEDIKRCLDLIGMGVSQDLFTSLDVNGISEKLDAWISESGESMEHAVLYLMAASGQDITELATSLGIDVGSELGSIIPDSLQKALNLGEKQVEKAKKGLTNAAKVQSGEKSEMEASSKEAGTGSATSLAEGQEEKQDEVEDATKTTTDIVKEKYEALPKEVQGYADTLMEYIVASLSDGDGTVTAAVEAVANAAVNRAKEILAGDVGIEIGTTFISGIRDGISTPKDGETISSMIESTCSDAVSILKGQLSYQKFYTIGQNMIVGLYNGFHSYSQLLVNFIASVCKTCKDTAKTILGIASPSKVFEQIGEYTMEGMQIGLENSGEDAVKAVSDISKSIVEAGEDANLENVMGDGLDNVASELERIVGIFSDLADTIASMGGLEIPTIAEGKTIPYKTQLGNNTYANGANGGLNADELENAFYSAFTRAMEGASNNNSQNINVYLDGKQIADSVTKYQRRQSRAMGV